MLEGIRTPDPRLRRPLLYPAELRTLINIAFAISERVMGIEPTYPAWKAGVLPLNYTRIRCMKLNTIEQKLLFLLECPVPESNQRHEDFQSSALPTELTGRLTTKLILKENGFAVKQKMQIFLII